LFYVSATSFAEGLVAYWLFSLLSDKGIRHRSLQTPAITVCHSPSIVSDLKISIKGYLICGRN